MGQLCCLEANDAQVFDLPKADPINIHAEEEEKE